MKFRMPQEGLSMVGERVDPTLPLEKQVYVCSPLFCYESAYRRIKTESDEEVCILCQSVVLVL